MNPFPLLVSAAVIHRDGRYLLAQRPPGSWMEGYWEFPGGKVESNEDPREGLAREIREELGVTIQVEGIAEVIFHRYPDRSVLLLFFHCLLRDGEPKGLDGQRFLWATPDEMGELPFLPADRPLVERLVAGE